MAKCLSNRRIQRRMLNFVRLLLLDHSQLSIEEIQKYSLNEKKKRTFMLNACIRCATSRPIRPRPITAKVLPFNSSPMKADRCQAPVFNELTAFGMLLQIPNKKLVFFFLLFNQSIHLAIEEIKAHVCSAAESVFPPGVLKTNRKMFVFCLFEFTS